MVDCQLYMFINILNLLRGFAMKEIINCKNAPAAIGPYSQAVKSGNTIYCSGALGIDPAVGKIVEGGIKAQAEQCLKNIQAILVEVGATVNNVVKTTVFITSMADFQEVNAAYSAVFTENFPARSCIAVKELPLAALVEIEVIVVL